MNNTSTKKIRRIYIRHADKEYANGNSKIYKHDPGITESGVEKSKSVAQYLINQWGSPDFIVCSPYKRTRETAMIMSSVLKNPVKIMIDSKLSEYLGNHSSVPMDVTNETVIYNPPHPETFRDMKRRVKLHNNHIINYIKNTQNTGVIWIITHGLIIKQVSSLIGIKMSKEFSTLNCLSILDGDNVTKGEFILFKNNAENLDNSDSVNSYESSDNLITCF